MITEAEILNPTGVMYIQENLNNPLSAVLAGSINVHNPSFSHTRTGEDTRLVSQEEAKISLSLLPYHFLSMTTGCELADVEIVIIVEKISERVTADYRTFEWKRWPRIKPDLHSDEQRVFPNANSASVQAEHLREISGLTMERLADIFDVSRTTYHKWINGYPLRDTHREHLLEILPLMEEAAQRLGTPNATSTWLLTPVSPGGKKPVEYLAVREYTLFRGFLLHVHTGKGMFRPLKPSGLVYRERSRQEIEDERERLNPGFRLYEDDVDTSDTKE